MEHVKNADMKAKRITNIIMVGFPLAGRGQGVMSEQRLAQVKSVSHRVAFLALGNMISRLK